MNAGHTRFRAAAANRARIPAPRLQHLPPGLTDGAALLDLVHKDLDCLLGRHGGVVNPLCCRLCGGAGAGACQAVGVVEGTATGAALGAAAGGAGNSTQQLADQVSARKWRRRVAGPVQAATPPQPAGFRAAAAPAAGATAAAAENCCCCCPRML